MAVLKSSMEEHKLKKQSKINTLLLAQDLSYARNLAANDEKVRKKALNYLKKYLAQRSKASRKYLTYNNVYIRYKMYITWVFENI